MIKNRTLLAILILIHPFTLLAREECSINPAGTPLTSLQFAQGEENLIAFATASSAAGEFALTRFDITDKITATGLASTPFLQLQPGHYFGHTAYWNDDLVVAGYWTPTPPPAPLPPPPPPLPPQPRLVIIPACKKTTSDAQLIQLRAGALVDAQAPVGMLVDSPVAGMVTTKNHLLVAVAQRGTTFAQPLSNNRGIAVLEKSGNELVQARAAGIPIPTAAINLEARLDNDPLRKLVFSDHTIAGGRQAVTEMLLGTSSVTMWWDDKLQRLYCGFIKLKKNNARHEGGAVGIAVGRFNGGIFEIEPLVVNPTAALFGFQAGNPAPPAIAAGADSNKMDRIVGFYHARNGVGVLPAITPLHAEATSNIGITVHHLKTMHTSTGKTYLIAGTEIGVTRRHGRKLSGIYYMPLIDNAADPLTHGKLQAATGGGPAAAFNELPNHTANRITQYRNPITGVIEPLNLKATQVEDITIHADSLLLSIQVRPGSVITSGVYITTALFNQAGDIIGWSPLVATGGVKEDAYAARFDTTTGNLCWLGNNRETVKVSTWGNLSPLAQQLQTIVSRHFPKVTGGARGIFTFDASTPTFNPHPGGARFEPGAPGVFIDVLADQRIGLIVILGHDKVMLAQIMQNGTLVGHLDDVDGSITQNVFVFQNEALKKIAPLTCAQILRVATLDQAYMAPGSAAENLGYLYVGGVHGICRLQSTAAVPAAGIVVGDGWQTRQASAAGVPHPTHAFVTGLSNLRTYMTSGANPAFVQLLNPDLKNVRAIVSTIGNPAGGRTQIAALCETHYVTGNLATKDLSTPKIDLAWDNYILDGVMIKNASGPANDESYLILATAQGLRIEPLGFAAPPAPHTIKLPHEDMPIQFAYLAPSKGGVGCSAPFANGGGGILYVLAGSQAMDETRIYSYAVQWDNNPTMALTFLGESQPKINSFRRFFAADGCQSLLVRDNALDNEEVAITGLLSNLKEAISITKVATPNTQLTDFVFAPQRDASSGSWLLPGSFGIKIQG